MPEIHNVTHFDNRDNTFLFKGNTLITCSIPDNAMIVVSGGALIIAGQFGRDFNFTTRHDFPVLQRAAAEITRPPLTLKLGPWEREVRPLDIVVLTPPRDFKPEDEQYKVEGTYLGGTIHSSRDLFFLQGSPNCVTSNVAGSLTCCGSLGMLNVANVMKDAQIDRIGDFSSVGCSGTVDTKEVGRCISISCAGKVSLGRGGNQKIAWDGSAVTCAGGFDVFGKLTNEDGINARLEYKKAPRSKRAMMSPPNIPNLSHLVVF